MVRSSRSVNPLAADNNYTETHSNRLWVFLFGFIADCSWCSIQVSGKRCFISMRDAGEPSVSTGIFRAVAPQCAFISVGRTPFNRFAYRHFTGLAHPIAARRL